MEIQRVEQVNAAATVGIPVLLLRGAASMGVALTGLNVATGELVCAIDANTLIEPDALLRRAAAPAPG